MVGIVRVQKEGLKLGAIVCRCHIAEVNRYKWIYSNGYAKSRIKGRLIGMHRFINRTPDGYDTDHINGDKMDNRCSNLRTVNKSQNQANRKKPKNNRSGVKGVSWHKTAKKWRVMIQVDGKHIYGGLFKEIEDAEKARKALDYKYFGEYANI